MRACLFQTFPSERVLAARCVTASERNVRIPSRTKCVPGGGSLGSQRGLPTRGTRPGGWAPHCPAVPNSKTGRMATAPGRAAGARAPFGKHKSVPMGAMRRQQLHWCGPPGRGFSRSSGTTDDYAYGSVRPRRRCTSGPTLSRRRPCTLAPTSAGVAGGGSDRIGLPAIDGLLASGKQRMSHPG